MKKFLTGVIAMGIISILTGCTRTAPINPQESVKSTKESAEVTKSVSHRTKSKDPVTIDYADYPENFMIQLIADQEYVLKNNDSSVNFSATTHALLKSNQILKYADLTSDLSRTVYYRKTEPVLIHYNNKDYIWICEESKDGQLISASFFYPTEYNSFGSDNGNVNLAIGDEILDPADFIMTKSVNCFGSSTSTVHYYVNDQGKPEELSTDDEYYYIDEPYTEEVLSLDDDIKAWVYKDMDASKSSVTKLPAGTTFRRLRIPQNAEYQYVEGILDDGRVMRVIEEYWFSEPTAYQAMLDKDANQFGYSVVQ